MMLDVSASLEYTTIQQKQTLIPVKEWTFQENEVSSKCLLLSVLFIWLASEDVEEIEGRYSHLRVPGLGLSFPQQMI